MMSEQQIRTLKVKAEEMDNLHLIEASQFISFCKFVLEEQSI